MVHTNQLLLWTRCATSKLYSVEAMADIRTYEASCHCRALRFRFRSEVIATGLRCNCSICVRKGMVMSSRYYAPESFETIEGADALGRYRFGDQNCNHSFCTTCGVSPFMEVAKVPAAYQGPAKPGYRRINLGCVDDLDVFALEIAIVDGRSF
jgi:hypothetical protein